MRPRDQCGAAAPLLLDTGIDYLKIDRALLLRAGCDYGQGYLSPLDGTRR